MQPLINLKSFLAVLLILIVPAALLVAYFRNYSPGAGGHEHSEMGKDAGAQGPRSRRTQATGRGDGGGDGGGGGCSIRGGGGGGARGKD